MPETSIPKDSRLDLRITKEQKELLERAAAIRGVSLSDYTLLHLLPIAREEVNHHERLVLSNRDRELFLSTMENPPKLKGKLKAVIQKYRDKYEQ